MNSDPIHLTRREIYQAVWKMPASALAKSYGISNVALAKICKKHDIPRPGLGYWRRLECGQKPIVPRLPRPKCGGDIVTIVGSLKAQVAVSHVPALAQLRALFQDPQNRVPVAEDLRRVHPLVRHTNVLLKALDASPGQRWGSAYGSSRLGVEVKRRNRRRALIWLSAFITTAEQCGFVVELYEQFTGWSKLRFGTVCLAFRLADDDHGTEPLDSQSQATAESAARLMLRVQHTHYLTGHQRIWKDGKKRQLEDQIQTILETLLTVTEGIRLGDIERAKARVREQEAHERWLDQQRLIEAERQRCAALEAQAKLWTSCCELRAFIDACEARLASKEPTMDPIRSATWLTWARAQAARRDPLNTSYLADAVRNLP